MELGKMVEFFKDFHNENGFVGGDDRANHYPQISKEEAITHIYCQLKMKSRGKKNKKFADDVFKALAEAIANELERN